MSVSGRAVDFNPTDFHGGGIKTVILTFSTDRCDFHRRAVVFCPTGNDYSC